MTFTLAECAAMTLALTDKYSKIHSLLNDADTTKELSTTYIGRKPVLY